jgi:hypothetical protein
VSVAVGDAVGVNVGVAVAVSVGVAVGVNVGVAVGVEVDVAMGQLSGHSASTMLHPAIRAATAMASTRPRHKGNPQCLSGLMERLCLSEALESLRPSIYSPDLDRRGGNRITSRIEGLSVNSMVMRSMPNPRPPVGGMPYSRARIQSSSMGCASSSPA